MTAHDDNVVSSVEEWRGVVVVEIARLIRYDQCGHVVLRPLPDVAPHVMETKTVCSVRVNRLSHIISQPINQVYCTEPYHTDTRNVTNRYKKTHKHI